MASNNVSNGELTQKANAKGDVDTMSNSKEGGMELVSMPTVV